MSIDAQALKIVEAALAVDEPEARAALVADRCGSDTALKARVEELLARDTGDFRLLSTESFISPIAVVDDIPARIGPYRVTGEIARGGMGAVVKAVRDDGVFEATVAIKLIRGDLASDRARRRFAEERRILAMLRHPGIVRIVDGGDIDNRPWLAMDFVDGLPVTEALDNASEAKRLDAFEAVCEAVAHAHRALVIHADIKPSNVLMSADRQVHLLDFGIARLIVDLDDNETGDPYPLTKGYAAPERGVGVAPTIASDVFSLGVLLLGMLGKAVPGEDTPCTPGTRLPVGQLDGDLAAIAGKALAERPEDRYPDVPALLSDVRRHRSWIPVAARGDAGWRYAAGRFVQRHRQGFVLSGAIGLGLIGATVFSTVNYVRAERARIEADARFMEMRRLVSFQLFDLYDRLAGAPGTVEARADIARTAERYLAQLRAVPRAPVDLRLESARGYRRLAAVSGLSGTASLGRPDAARAALDQATALIASVLAETPDDPAALAEAGWIDADRWTLLANGPESAATTARARRSFEAALARSPQDAAARFGLVAVAKAEAYDMIKGSGEHARAEALLRRALTDLRALSLPASWHTERHILEYELLSKLGDAVYYGGNSQASLPHYRAALALAEAQLARGAIAPAWLARQGEALWNVSGVVEELPGRKPEALALADRGVAALTGVLTYGPDANAEKKLAILQSQRGLLLAGLGRFGDAETAIDASLAIRTRRLAGSPDDPVRRRDVVIARMSRAEILAQTSPGARACTAARDALAGWNDIEARGTLSPHDRKKNVAEAKAAVADAC